MEQVPETAPAAAPYQVFINHRGPDVKKTLASLIYHSLTSYGLTVFLDKDEIRTGDTIAPAILGAIQSASVHVAIFSEQYAESSWCLEELHWILRSYHERNTKIIPVFFGVEPNDLRHIESGPYAIAFKKHQRQYGVAMEVLEKWKTALKEASHISGFPFKRNESDHGEIWKNIVNIVLEEVFKREAIEVAKYPVGLDQAAEDFQKEILKHSHSNATTIVGIAGLSGVGKSTLAKHLYNLKRPDFSRSSILCEVREKGLRSSQEKLLRDLLGNYPSQHIDSISQGKRILRDCLPRLPPVFIVLDDVDNMDQIESLLDVDAVASGSLILITSCDKDVLRRSSAKTVVRVYDVKTLHQHHARELFCRHAFSHSKPSEELDDLIEEFLKICGGLPLSLKVLGGLLASRCDKGYWERQLKKFSTTLPNQIVNSLKVSYEALGPEEKEVFLDIGCFFVGEEKELAIRVLEGLHDYDVGEHLESLHKKCFVNFDYDVQLDDEIERRKWKYPKIGYNYVCLLITMHSQLRELARHIAREEFRDKPTQKPLRLSSSTDMEMLRSQAGPTIQIRGIRSWKDENSSIGNNREIRVEGVRFLVVEHESFEGTSFWRQQMSGDLVWLRLCRPSSSRILHSMSLWRLRVLEIHGSNPGEPPWFLDDLDPLDPPPNTLTGPPPHDYTIPPSSSKVGQPESSRQRPLGCGFGGFGRSFYSFLENRVTSMKTLTKLVLKNIGFLQSLPIDFSQLRNLKHLDLSGCSKLTELPNTFSELLQLQYLALQDCFELSIPLDILGEISTLEYVDFQGCAKLVCLPERILYQTHLRYLNLLGTGLLRLPNNLEMLHKLEQIAIGSSALKQIPLTVANLKGLAELFLIECSGLQQILPEGIAAPNIKILAIDRCPIDNFSFQRILDAQNIHLRVGMNSLRDFILTNTSISQISIPDCVSPRLETVDLSGNIQLMRVDALPSTLVSLNLQNCSGLKTLTRLSNLENLKFLNINRCFNLKSLNMEGLASLEEIKAEECWELERLQGLNRMERLKCLNINRCFNLKSLNMEGLASLEEIKAEECWELQRLQGSNRMERLKCLHISTDNRDFWNDICLLFTSPTHQKPSTAIFSGTADNDKIFGQEDMQRIAKKFHLEILDIVFLSATIGGLSKRPRPRPRQNNFQRLNNFHSHSAILMFLVTDNVKTRLCVRFTPAISHEESPVEYSVMPGNRRGRSVHVFMWTEESRLFKEYSVYSDINVAINAEASIGVRGWIVMVDKETDVSELCRELIMASA